METDFKSKPVKISDQFIMDSMNEFEKSNLSLADFCELYEIDEDTFFLWQKKHSKLKKGKGIFIPVQPDESLFGSQQVVLAEVVLPGGSVIKLLHQVDPVWFKSLIC